MEKAIIPVAWAALNIWASSIIAGRGMFQSVVEKRRSMHGN